ncbi:MAG: ribosomal-protein-alanine N-acetyltransferase [Methanobacteriota archaeon]|nr:MAG: ribosomal-protein-alanine N-acetyltransferase [Euryarchaeota archaeon]
MVQQLLRYRTPNLGDVEEIVEVNRLALPENYPVAYFIQLIKDWKDTSVVAELDSQVIGYIITRIEKQSLFSFKRGHFPRAHIISVAVHPDYRRQGIGRDMMEFILQKISQIKGLKEIILEVRVSNYPAIRLYEKFGFYVKEVLDKYYIDGEAANLMTLPLV